jgi:hypothetical protein
MEEMKNIPCRCLCDAHKKMSDVRCSENGQTDVLEESNYSDHSYSDALVVWQKCARHMYHHYLCQLLETLKVVDRGGSGRVSRVDNRLHEGVLRDILYLSLYIIAEEDHDSTITTPRPESDRSHGVFNGVSGKTSCSESAVCRLNCTNVKYINEHCARHFHCEGGGGGGRGRKKDVSHVTSSSGSGSSSGCGRTRSPSCLVIVRDIISDSVYPSHTANTAVLCAAYGCYKEALEACRQHLLMHSPQHQHQQQQRHQQLSNKWHGTKAVSEGETNVEVEAETEAEMVHSQGGRSHLQKGHLCDGRNGASSDAVPSVRTVLLRCLQITVSRMVTHALSTGTQGGPDSRSSASALKPSLSPAIQTSAAAVSSDVDERRCSDIGADIADDVILAIKLLWVLLAREMTTGREGDMEEKEMEEAADGAIEAMIETIVSCMMSSPVCLCAPALESTETASHTDTAHTTQHNDHMRDCLQAVWTPGGTCIDPQVKTWTLDLLSRTPSPTPSTEPDPDSSFRCYTLNDLRGTVAMSLSKCVLTALGSHLTAKFIRALPASFFDFLDLDFIAELVD